MIDFSRRPASPSPLVAAQPVDTGHAPAEAKPRKLPRRPVLNPSEVHAFVQTLVGDDYHAKRVLSLSSGVVGVVHAAGLAVHAIGQGLAQAQGLNPKHAVKQVDRLLSNRGVDLPTFFARWVPYVLADRTEAVVIIDWTDFDKDNHCTVALNLVTSHGRATALMWKSVDKSALEGWRNQHEDDLLLAFQGLIPAGLRVTILADRAFGDQKLYQLLDEQKLDYVIRFRGIIKVTFSDGTGQPAEQLVPSNGRPKLYKDVAVTADFTPVAGVVCVHARDMKEPWHLATSRRDLTAAQIVKLYGHRFSIEETFRDEKDARYGLGLSQTSVASTERRDRQILLAVLAHALLTLLGAAAEQVGLDRVLKVNTSKKRTHSLFRQGSYWYGAIPTMREDWLEALMGAFGQAVSQHVALKEIFGVI